MSRFSANATLAELKSFQRDAVDHVMYRLYDAPKASGRFLVADETGLGKSVIARGIIARTIERLQDDDTVDRIDIVYICSNSDLASQNLRRLNVTGDPHIGLTSRLSLLARESNRLAGSQVNGRKPVNLVSFTPGTSFDMGSWRTGSGDERALLHIMLTDLLGLSKVEQRASRILFQGPIKTKNSFQYRLDLMQRSLDGPVAVSIRSAFEEGITKSNLRDDYLSLLGELYGRSKVPELLTHQVRQLTAKLREALARASVDSLEPDLIILDEFQRFRHLLDKETGGEAAELAHTLFDYRAAKVLLLSATPYKPFTEATDEPGDDHYSDLMITLGFLAEGSDVSLADIRGGFAEYRQQLLNGQPVVEQVEYLRANLLTVMSRTERPPFGDMIWERRLPSLAPTASDLAGYVALERLSTELDVPIGLEYWKSIPYFASFMDGYKVTSAVNRRLLENDGSITEHLRKLQQLVSSEISEYKQVELGNSHLRAVAEETLDKQWWKLLWLPPSLPYLKPGNVYGAIDSSSVTKRVIFSSWSATPTSIASLLSYEAERRIVSGSRLTVNSPEARKRISARLDYKVNAEARPVMMSTLALFWPHPLLAEAGDPLRVVRESEGSQASAEDAEARVLARLAPGLESLSAWEAFFSTPGAMPTGLALDVAGLAQILSARPVEAKEEEDEEDEAVVGLQIAAHVELAVETIGHASVPNSHPDLARLALHAPGNIAFRALGRLREAGDETSDAGHWKAAAMLSNGIRALFNRIESIVEFEPLYAVHPVFFFYRICIALGSHQINLCRHKY